MIYFNNAATSFPKPDSVIDGVQNILTACPEQDGRGFSQKDSVTIDACRSVVADFFNTSHSERIVFNSGATESINTLLFGIIPSILLIQKDKSKQRKYRVFTTQTEHNSVLRPLYHLEDQGVIELVILSCDQFGMINIGELESEVKNRFDLLIVNHASNVTGVVQDLSLLSSLAKETGALFIVDASQTSGHLAINLSDLLIDALIFTGHKGLLGMKGSGGFYLAPGIDCQPFKYGGTGHRSDLKSQPNGFHDTLEAGTKGLPGAYSIAEGIKWISDQGLAKIHQHESLLKWRAIDLLKDNIKIKIYSADKEIESVGLFSFNIEGFTPDDVGYILYNSYGIITRSGLHCAPLIHKALGSFPKGSLRVSFSAFNTSEEVDVFVKAVLEIAG